MEEILRILDQTILLNRLHFLNNRKSHSIIMSGYQISESVSLFAYGCVL